MPAAGRPSLTPDRSATLTVHSDIAYVVGQQGAGPIAPSLDVFAGTQPVRHESLPCVQGQAYVPFAPLGTSTDGLVCLVRDVMNNQPGPPAQTELAYESVNEGSSWKGRLPAAAAAARRDRSRRRTVRLEFRAGPVQAHRARLASLADRAAGTVVAMVSDHRSRIHMPTATLGAEGPVVSRIGLGLAALGRPAYITSGREEDLPDRSVAGLRTRTFSILDAAYAAGVRYVDAARSYGRAEEFLADWLADHGHADVIVGSKWGYRYTGGWRLEMVFTQLAKRAVRPVGGDREDVADLDLVVGDDHPVDEQLGQLPALVEGGGGQPGPDGLAECLDPVGDSGKLQPLLGDRV